MAFSHITSGGQPHQHRFPSFFLRTHTMTHKLTFFYLSAYYLLALLFSYVAAAPFSGISTHVHDDQAPRSELGLGLGLGKRATPGSKSVIIQMFEWTWDSVASECTSFIGPAGYGYVQGAFVAFLLLTTGAGLILIESVVSPPQEHVTGPQWWTDYQPVSYILTSKRGNRTQFRKCGRPS
jgi:hypothetical protein